MFDVKKRITLAVLIVFFSKPFLRFLSCLNTLFHANPSLRTPKLLSWVSHARSFAGIFSIFTSPFSPWAYFCTRSAQRKTLQSSLTVARKPLGRIAFALWGCDRRLRNAQFVWTRITSCHVRDSLVLSSFLLISVFLSRSLSLSRLSPASWIATINTVKARQPHGQTHTDPKPERRGKVHCHQRRRSEWMRERGKTESGNRYDVAVASPQSFYAPSRR